MSGRSPRQRAELRIMAGDQNAIIDRWRWGRDLLADKKLVNDAGTLRRGVGAVERLVAEAESVGRKLSEREIQNRLKAARTYPTEAVTRSLTATYDTWTALAP